MPPDIENDTSADVAGEYVAIPLAADGTGLALRVCIVARREPDPVAGQLVELRTAMDARVLLGCLVDQSEHIHRWVEVWLQDADGLARSALAWCQRGLSNHRLDERWKERFHALEELEDAEVIRTGWETAHPPPLWLSGSELNLFRPVERVSGRHWQLCREDALLARKSLPPYSTSLHRYLCVPELGSASEFVPVTEGAPTNEHVVPLSAMLGERQPDLIPLNPQGGLMLIRGYSPISWDAFVDVLGGGSWGGLWHGRSELDLWTAGHALRIPQMDSAGQGRLFLPQHGRAGRLTETFHVKLRLLADAVRNVRTVVEHTQSPHLGIRARAFQIRLGEPGCGLPLLWTARASLVEAGDAVEIPLEENGTQYYVRGSIPDTSAYLPAQAGVVARGLGTVRIRQILEDQGAGGALEGTLAAEELVEPAESDLLWLRLNLTPGRLDLYAHVQPKAELAVEELRFRTLEQQLTDETVAALRAAEGMPIANVQFQSIPVLSTPCDLYALAMLAVRTLLVDRQTTLPRAVDETLSLARQVADRYEESVPLSARIAAIFDQDERWLKALGPHRLTVEEVPPTEAFTLVPPPLWFEMLAMIVRMIPAAGPDSECRDYGHGLPGGLHRTFDQAVIDLNDLLTKTRSLIVVDWRFNREVSNVIHETAEKMGIEDLEATPEA